jgi:hypothetical protein
MSSKDDREQSVPREVELPSFDPNPSAGFGYEILTEVGAEFALIGKVALWAHLPPSSHEFTKDVDFAVRHEAVEPLRAALARRGITARPLAIGGLGVREQEVRVDFIDRREGGLASLFEAAIADAARDGARARVGRAHLPIASPEYLVALKVATGEDRDEHDAVRLLSGIPTLDLARAREILAQHAGPGSANRLDALARRAGRRDARPEYRNSG